MLHSTFSSFEDLKFKSGSRKFYVDRFSSRIQFGKFYSKKFLPFIIRYKSDESFHLSIFCKTICSLLKRKNYLENTQRTAHTLSRSKNETSEPLLTSRDNDARHVLLAASKVLWQSGSVIVRTQRSKLIIGAVTGVLLGMVS